MAGCLIATLKTAYCRSKADPYLAAKGLSWAVPTSWSPEFGWPIAAFYPGILLTSAFARFLRLRVRIPPARDRCSANSLGGGYTEARALVKLLDEMVCISVVRQIRARHIVARC